AGFLSVFGIQQRGNEDAAVFDELPANNAGVITGPADQLGRAQIVSGAGDDFWVLARGELRRRHFDKFGQRIVDIWHSPLLLGSPLHSSQVNESTKTAFVVT